ncbi:hypothetical protein PCANC_07282 [Puccinia coronata f. sp. avenae]|uniref:Uncharacterized protein n=1 Tax=Puccinia coronata f. sp. avenae TaxID=200324 RepID=A0A2N5VS22_9BASI|nr:hypothetical protein PCASD_12053 [Puccinia coronata f. sp. avenae]PLW42686.1 hypothetical protein PCASD_08508 [Puccinia coronata f. sp. avenae]PLW52766.1 hypothetical protein PCANC_07282 [Puccinia coronata f. sp. avenae]
MATEASLVTPLNEPHSPNQHGLQLFENCVATIRHELVKLRHHWDKHEPRMFARAQSISDQDLCRFNIKEDLVLIRAGKTSYGAVVFGKIKLPAIKDAEGEGFLHVRLHDPPGEGNGDVIFHSIWTDEIKDPKTGHIMSYRAIMRREDPLNWFNE